MKLRKVIWCVLAAMLLSFSVQSQSNNTGFRQYKKPFIKQLKFGLGWSFVETDQRPLYVFDGFGGWRGSWLPKTINVEKRFDPAWRLNLGIAHTRYAQRLNQSERSNYFSIDLNAMYNFRAFKHYATLRKTHTLKNLYKERFYFDGYFLGGIGYNNIAAPSLNTGIGADYWFHYSWGINFQTTAKWTFDANNRFHMHHMIGVVYRIDEGNDAGALNTIRRNQSRKRKKRIVKKAVIPEKKQKEESDEMDDDFDDFTD